MTISEELDALLANLPNINPDKKYWLIRTQSGSLYNIFYKNKIVAIEHNLISYNKISEYQKSAEQNIKSLYSLIKDEVRRSLIKKNPDVEHSERDVSLKTNQITKFVFEIKKGDVVIIPSVNSDFISFGEVTENHIAALTEKELQDSDYVFDLARKVKWQKEIPRSKLDLNLYKLFTTHQTISNVTWYSESIERTLNDLFVLKDSAHIILEVNRQGSIPAKDLFGIGYDLLQMIDDFAIFSDLEIDSSDLDVQINLNSPGLIDFKSKIKRTTVIMGLILLVAGGGYEDKSGHSFKTEGLPGIIKTISSFLNDQNDREMKKELFNKYKDSLHITNPEDLNKALKQFSDNKDLPK